MARISKRLRRLWDTYSFEGFRAEPVVRGVFGDPKVRIVTLKRRSKKRRVDAVAASRSGGTTAKSGRCVTCPRQRLSLSQGDAAEPERPSPWSGRNWQTTSAGTSPPPAFTARATASYGRD